MGCMDPDLVGSTGLQTESNERRSCQRLDRLDVCHSALARRFFDHSHSFPISWIAPKVGFNDRGLGDPAPDNCEIVPVNCPVKELLRKVYVHRVALCYHDQARGVFVETVLMDDRTSPTSS